MTYSIIITILITTLLAFYYLYKSKELNLGIFMSISIGAVILGITFNPAYNTIFGYLKSITKINPKVGFVFCMVIVMLFFLILVLTISILVSVCLPAKLSSIDFCFVIDRFVSRTRNDLKSAQTENNTVAIPENNTYYEDTELLHTEAENLTEALPVENEDNQSQKLEMDISKDVETNEFDFEAPISDISESDFVNSVEQGNEVQEKLDENEYAGVNEAEILVLKAFDCKVKGQREQAVQYYIKALNYSGLNSEMVFWIVLDVCTLYKELGLNELACNILNGVSEKFGDRLKPEIRKEIINNLK